ncbi:NAD(P)/FAD-dependent oxidoreductase [Erythrobacter sp. QSSC1-22B]|uniref:NAD(P)/FAD-dependent oxidoreductase n=1 Tax=Erythrobacter sp. QSSC1-22B TaxID=1860125 RepID=UPI000B1F9B6B|nr:FAD-dependent monooxygenase [Erythrobacter sp. QSSC1-22B]
MTAPATMPATAPVVLGAGPAGCAAAIVLARSGAEPLLIDRDAEVGDALCGGFMSWRTAATTRKLGIDLEQLGAQRVTALRLFAGRRFAQSALPEPAYGLSRRGFDSALRRTAVAAGARLEVDTIRALAPGCASGESREYRSDSLFLASGKHDLRGATRPRGARDPALGLRLRIAPDPQLTALIGETIELHLFAGGYAGIVLQEDGSANICLALRKSLLARAGNDPAQLLDLLAGESESFAARLQFAPANPRVDTIAAVPYGWIAQDTAPGLFRLGDQAAVIPSLAGEGMSIAIASGMAAAQAWQQGGGGAAPAYQQTFARRARRPVRVAEAIWQLAERELGGHALTQIARSVAPAARLAMRLSRIAA